MMDPLAELEAELSDGEAYPELHAELVRSHSALLDTLVSLRKQQGLTQEEVATRMRRSLTCASEFERLGSDPRLSTLRRYAASIGATISHNVASTDSADQA